MENRSGVFNYKINIHETDIDEMGHVNNVVYLKWVQEAATAHWNFIATDKMKLECLWVVSRHEIDYLRPCFLESRLFAETWVGKSEGARSERYVTIMDSITQKTIAKVKTTWTMLDATTKRPVRIDEALMDLFR